MNTKKWFYDPSTDELFEKTQLNWWIPHVYNVDLYVVFADTKEQARQIVDSKKQNKDHPKAPIGAVCYTRSGQNQYVKTLDGWMWVGEFQLGYAGFPEWELDGLYWEQTKDGIHTDKH